MGVSSSKRELKNEAEENKSEFIYLLNKSKEIIIKEKSSSASNINKKIDEIIPCLNCKFLKQSKEKMENILTEEDNIIFYDVLMRIIDFLFMHSSEIFSSNECPHELRIYLDSIVYVGTRLQIEELKKIREIINKQYGAEYISKAVNNENKLINEIIIEKLRRNMKAYYYPEALIKEKLKQLCIKNDYDYQFIYDSKQLKISKDNPIIKRGNSLIHNASKKNNKNKISENNKNINNIIQKGEEIFLSYNKNIDKKCYKINYIENWADAFYNLKSGVILNKYKEILSKSEYNNFFDALNYEYGLNNYPLDTKKALKLYIASANNTTDTISMYRLYHIYKKDFKKFDIKERNHILELFYIMKCFVYLTSYEKKNKLFQRFDIAKEVEALIIGDDNIFYDWYKQIFDFLYENYIIYNVNKDDLALIDVVMYYYFEEPSKNAEGYINNVMFTLLDKDNPEAIYNYISYFNQDKTSNKYYYEKLYNMNYYRSFEDYALQLTSKKDGLKILKKSISNGYYSHIRSYLKIFMISHEIEEILTTPSLKSELVFIFQGLINMIIVDDIETLLEYIYMRKVLVKHFNFENEFKSNLEQILKEYIKYLKKLIESNDEENKKKIKSYFISDNYFKLIYSIIGSIYFYGVKGILEKNSNETLKKFNYLIKNNEIFYDENFYLYKIYCIKNKERLNRTKEDKNKPNKINKDKLNKINKDKHNKNISNNDNELKELQKKNLNLIYENVTPDKIKLLPPSIFYKLSKLYNRKNIDKGDIILEYIFLNRAYNAEILQDEYHSIFMEKYIKYKAKKKLKVKNKEQNYKKIKETKKGAINIAGYDDGTICPICLTNKKSSIALPCRHFFCLMCMDNLLIKGFCPICRTEIKITFDINLKRESLIKTIIKYDDYEEEGEGEEEEDD